MEFFRKVLLCTRDNFRVDEFFSKANLDECLLYVYEENSVESEIFAAEVYYFEEGRPSKISDRGRLSIDRYDTRGVMVNDDKSEKPVFTSAAHFSNLNGSFFSSLSSRNSYRELMRRVGIKVAKSLLLEANDVAALYAFKLHTKKHKSFRYSSMYQDFSRRDEEFYSYLSLKQIFEEDEASGQERIDRLSTVVSFSKSVELPISFSFKSDEYLISSVNVVIGPNGVGKTRLLKGIAENFVQNSMVLNSHAENTLSQYFPLIVFSHEKQHWRKVRRSGALCLSLGISSKEWGELPGVVQQLHFSGARTRRGRISIIENILSRFINTKRLCFRVLDGHRNLVSLFDLSENPDLCKNIDISKVMQFLGDDDTVHQLSSGQRSLIGFTLNVILNCKRRSLLLIDEPENHLHPQFISLLMQTLSTALQAVESVAILVTHSPYVVREVEKSAVLILDADESGLPVVYRPTLQTLGGDISLISDYVFGDLDLRKGYQEMIDRVMSDSYSSDKKAIAIKSLSGLGGDAVTYLKSVYKG